MNQIALPLDLEQMRTTDAYVITPANQAVHDALENWQNWPNMLAILVGPARSGKSAMARFFERKNEGYVLDDADMADEQDVFHLWNKAREEKRPLLLTSKRDMASWQIALPDLRSRLANAVILDIGDPDDVMTSQLFYKYFAQRGMAVSEDVVAFLCKRIERTYEAIEESCRNMDALAAERKKPISLAVARDSLMIGNKH